MKSKQSVLNTLLRFSGDETALQSRASLKQDVCVSPQPLSPPPLRCSTFMSLDLSAVSCVTEIGDDFLYSTNVTSIDFSGLTSLTRIGDSFLADFFFKHTPKHTLNPDTQHTTHTRLRK